VTLLRSNDGSPLEVSVAYTEKEYLEVLLTALLLHRSAATCNAFHLLL
jgi:hypothetical protein